MGPLSYFDGYSAHRKVATFTGRPFSGGPRKICSGFTVIFIVYKLRISAPIYMVLQQHERVIGVKAKHKAMNDKQNDRRDQGQGRNKKESLHQRKTREKR